MISVAEKTEIRDERDKKWFQIIESILDFHPVSMTEALNKGIAKVKQWKHITSAAEDKICGDANCHHNLCRAILKLKGKS